MLLKLVKTEHGNPFPSSGFAYLSFLQTAGQPGGAILLARVPFQDV
jgi:hypothetical protein